jgi:hypothetical protein
MERHQRIVLENAPSADFQTMLRGGISIENYVSGLESAFPTFEQRMCVHLRELHHAGRRIVEVEPYLEKLGAIHDRFERGETPGDILDDAELKEVYLAEKGATGALITYYGRSRQAPFEDVVEAVKAFARTDARRLVLRDQMRAGSIAPLVRPGEATYVEAGYLHHPLGRFLRRELSGKEIVRVVYPLAPFIEKLGGKRHGLTPGDRLTLSYTIRRPTTEVLRDRLAAQSLIHIQIVGKEELLPDGLSHVEDEIRANRLVESLELHQCRELFERIRDQTQERALESVKEYAETPAAITPPRHER